jgi:flagella synthesis protein FlgN
MALEMTELLRTVAAEADAASKFIELLKLEQKALTIGDIDSLSALIPNKGAIASTLASLAVQRNTLLATHKLAPDRGGIEAWLKQHPAEQRMRTAWSQVLTLAEEAHELNRVNGDLIQMRMQHNAQMLEALLGASKALNLYGPDGKTSSQSAQRINAAA